MKNLFIQNPKLIPWLNGVAKYFNDMGNQVAEWKGAEYFVEIDTYILAVRTISDPQAASRMANVDINKYRSAAIRTNDGRGIWYELGLYTCALDTLCRFVETVADNPDVFLEKGVTLTKNDIELASQLYGFYAKQFNRLKRNCLENLNEEESAKYYKFID